ncbi:MULTISPECIES: restriction endonuclease subunit S [Aeromonas]|uniref:restriction endonuclease subunit S n=1 Tax=Aeromonas TaxID=642 RepID=UPI0038D19109
MSSDWEPTTLGSVCDRQGGSIQTGPFGSQLHASDYVEQGIPVVMPANIGSDGGISEDGIARITQFDADRLQQHKLQVGDVVFSRRGDVTRNALIEAHQAGWLCGTGCLKVRLGSQTQASAKFISYCLRLPETKDWLVRHAVGATMPNLNTSILSAVPILLPELPVQQSIANILGCLDERIDLLRETNATLEAIVQALFKSWFVDFDPVHARARGEQLAGLAPEVAALFPDSFEESALGLVPKGWKYVSLKEATDIFDSKRIPLAGQERAKRKGPYPYYGAAALMDWVDDYIFDGVYLLMGEDGSVADASGYPITQYVWGKIWVNNHAHVLQGRNGISTEHLMLALKGVNIQPFITGAVQAKLSQSNMWRIQFLMPTQSVASAFADLISPMFAKIRANSEQAQTLANLRDTLLPRLISGQLRLPEAEAMVEGAS